MVGEHSVVLHSMVTWWQTSKLDDLHGSNLRVGKWSATRQKMFKQLADTTVDDLKLWDKKGQETADKR